MANVRSHTSEITCDSDQLPPPFLPFPKRMAASKPRVLLTNDDGPPDHESPYIFGLSLYLSLELGWDVKVVIPSSQKSWIGKAFHIKEITNGRYFYPKHPDGLGEVSEVSRPLREGEVAEWILLDGTPATCVNIALHNIYPGQIDLVISGPNYGRNTSSAFALCSGTVGAAMSAALAKKRAIALSYGTFLHPTPTSLHEPANRLAGVILQQLWSNWGKDPIGIRGDGEVDLYNVNIPVIHKLLSQEGVGITWSSMWRNSYGRLFTRHIPDAPDISAAGPDSDSSEAQKNNDNGHGNGNGSGERLVFKFAPDMAPLVHPNIASLPQGTDAWAVHNDYATVTPLRASFAEPPPEVSMVFEGETNGQSSLVRHWKMKL